MCTCVCARTPVCVRVTTTDLPCVCTTARGLVSTCITAKDLVSAPVCLTAKDPAGVCKCVIITNGPAPVCVVRDAGWGVQAEQSSSCLTEWLKLLS